MVNKIGKYGARSGNTFRIKHKRFDQRYSRSACIIRQHTGAMDDPAFATTGILGEDKAMVDGVHYSLNKQNRWELPDIIEDLIINDEHEKDFDFQLIQRHKVMRDANCVAVASTNGVFRGGKVNPDRKFKIKNRGGFFQANSVLKSKPSITRKQKREHRRRLQQGLDDTEDGAVVADKSYVRYEVFYPAPSTSYLAHSDKHNGIDTWKPYMYSGYQDKCYGKHRKRSGFVERVKEDVAYMEDSVQWAEDDEEAISIYDEMEATYNGFEEAPEYEAKPFSASLEDMLTSANKVNSLLNGRKRRHSSTSSKSSECETSGKGHVVYVTKDNTESSINDSAQPSPSVVNVRPHVEMLPVMVTLDNEETDPQRLQEIYGNDCVEASCFPRKFTLDISQKVTNLDDLATHCQTTAFLVFVHDVDNDMNTMKESVYKIYFNANFDKAIHSVKIETLFDYMETNIDEIVEQTLFYISSLPGDALVWERNVSNYRGVPKATTVEKCANWSASSYRPNNTVVLQKMFSCGNTDNQEARDLGYNVVSYFDSYNTDESLDVVSPRDHFCSICYEELCAGRPGTALMTCGHWFCDGCWEEFVNVQIERGQTNLQCPEYDCDKKVDAATLISLVNARDVIRHARHCHDNLVEQNTVSTWCPNAKCGRVVQVNTDEVKFAKCVCGSKFCLECLQPSHWPAPCQAVVSYHQRLKKTGDIDLIPAECYKPVIVNGKNCPNCKRFIEKNGGCPYMSCMCGTGFCWGCGHSWNSRTHGAECYKGGYKDDHNTREFRLEQRRVENTNSSNWYKQALKHRLNQHPAKVAKMKSKMKHLTTQAQWYFMMSARNGQSLTDELPEIYDYCKSEDKAKGLLRNTLDMYKELNHVIENACVLLSSKELPSNTVSRLQYITKRLSGLVESIYSLFMSQVQYGQARVFMKNLNDVRFHSKKGIESLIRLVKSVDV